VGLVARLVVGGVWLWAGAAKVTDPSASIASVRAYELLPGSLVAPVGYALPALEIVVGAALVLGLLTRGAALVSVVLLVAFVVGISWAWSHGLSIDCGCFGDGGYDPDAASRYPWEIARDVALAVASAYLVLLPRSRLSLDALLFRPLTDDDLTHDHQSDADPAETDLIDTGRNP